jgi:hypothetical protein
MRILAIALALLLARQDEKFTFKFAPKQGDKITRTKNVEFNMAIDVEAGGQTQSVEIEQRESAKLIVEYAGVEDGKVTKRVVDCVEAFEEKKQPPMMEWERTDKPLHGRKVTVTSKPGEKPVYEGADGLTESNLTKLREEDQMHRIFPTKPVAVGDTWELKDDEVKEFLETDQKLKKATLKAKFDSVKEIDKRRCAILKVTIDLTSTAPNDAEVGAKIEGDAIIWIERGMILEFKGKGKITLKGDSDEMSMTGEGKITLDFTSKVE